LRRRVLWILGVPVALALLVVLGVLVVVPRMDLGSYAAARARAALGRDVAIESLHVSPGLQLGVELRGLRLANIEGGSQPDMMTLRHAVATVDLMSLFGGGPVVIRDLAVEGLALLLERAPGRRANWHFGDRVRPPRPSDPVTAVPAPPPERAGTPTLLEARFADSEVVFRTTSGTPLRMRLDSGAIAAPTSGEAVLLQARGAYNDLSLELDGTLGSFDALRDVATPFPMELQAASGAVRLSFQGTATDPINFDGLEGELALDAPTLEPILEMAGAEGISGPSVTLTGAFLRHTDLWRLTDAQGTLDGAPLTAALLQLIEGAVGQPNSVEATMSVTRLDLNRIAGQFAPGDAPAGQADAPLVVPAMPDPLVQARLEVGELLYAEVHARQVALRAEMVPGRIAVPEATLTAYGSRIAASGEITPLERGARIAASVAVSEGDMDTLRRAFGLHALPVSGLVDARVAVEAQGTHLNEATRRARVSAVVSMRNGRIAREVIEMASTDVRAVFRTARGMTPVGCLLAVVDIRDSRGDAVPLRIRSGEGTIGGIARFDLTRQTMDLVIGSERATTGLLALDIPVRVSGSFANPSVAPARWSGEGRAQLEAADTRIAPMPAELRQFAQQNPCIRRTTAR